MGVTVGVVPKSTANPYFQECQRGALEAASELGFTLRWDGPQEADARRQAEIVEGWIREGLPAIAVSVESQARLGPILKDARSRGVKVLTWDSDADADARDFTVVSATPESIAHALSFEVGRILGGKGALAAITSTLFAPNQNAWIAGFKARLAKDYPDLKLVDVRPCDDVADNARAETLKVLASHPHVKAIVGFCSPAVPGAAEALREARRTDVRVTGVSLPSLCRRDIEDGVVDSVVIWNTRDLGYLVALSAHALAGRLGSVVVLKDAIRLGRCHIVSRGNIADFH